MKGKELKIQYQIAELSELSETEQELVKKAMDATNHAYANYSHFYVGAACLSQQIGRASCRERV